VFRAGIQSILARGQFDADARSGLLPGTVNGATWVHAQAFGACCALWQQRGSLLKDTPPSFREVGWAAAWLCGAKVAAAYARIYWEP